MFRRLVVLALFALVTTSACTQESLTAPPVVDQPPVVQPVAASLGSFTLASSSVFDDGSVTATVTLTGPAPAGGARITLASDSNAAAIPADVTIPAGGISAPVVVVHNTPSQTRTVILTATYLGVSRTATLIVQNSGGPPPPPPPPPGVMNLTGRWTGRVTMATGAFVDLELNIVQTGDAISGSCRANGAPSAFSLRIVGPGPNGTTWLLGGCAGSLDAEYRPATDVLNLIYRVDYAGNLRR